MAFEVFNRKSARMGKSQPFITIQRRGNFSMNASAIRMIAEGSGDLEIDIELLFDPENQIVGFRRSQNAVNAYSIRKQPNSESYLVAGKAFTEHYGIDTETARRFQARIIEPGIIGFSLLDQSKGVERTERNQETARGIEKTITGT